MPALTSPIKIVAASLHVLTLVLVLGAVLAGCNRAQYRRQADTEAYELIQEKRTNPRWMLPRTSIDIDPRSRMFDPFDPDRPPMPPDDPASHELMHLVDGKPNYPRWHKDGDIPVVESPAWMNYLPADENGVLRLDLSTAIQLALLHSPDYQQEYEDLYLSALDVSAERFRFDTQFFAGKDIYYTANGRDRSGPETPRSGLLVDSIGRGAGLTARKAFITGADLVVNFANRFVWDFHGPDTNVARSLLDFSLVQPLLRQAGRDRVLTQLTLAERQLLANVRQMERFRRGFYLEIATGDGGTFGARRIGGLFGGSGLQGFTGVGGGFGGVGGAFSGAGGAQAAGAALQVGGFLGLLQEQQNIRNQQSNIAGLRSNVIQFQQTLRENLRQIPEDPTEVVRNRLQIAQARQTLYNQEFAQTSAQAQYQSRVDDLKVELGLPPHLCVVIEDPLLDQFNLLDTAIVPLQDEVANLSQLVGEVNEQILQSVQFEEIDGTRTARIPWSEELATQLGLLQSYLARIKSVRDQIGLSNVQRARDDIDQLKELLPRRRQSLRQLREKYFRIAGGQQQRDIVCQTRLPADVDPTILDSSRLDNLAEELEQELARLLRQLPAYEEPVQRLEDRLQVLLTSADKPDPTALYEQLEKDILFDIPGLISNLTSDLLDLLLVQARARADAIDVVPVDLPMEMGLRIASVNRRDWMNARASLVDTWRAIAFVANDLEGVLDVFIDGDISTTGDNPLNFSGRTGRLRVGVQIDAPLTRLLERNNYRQVLIDYQQARRSYYQFIDRVSQSLRNTIRTLELNQLNFETRRVAVLSAIDQIVLNDEIQTLSEERGEAQGVTAARDIVQALSDLQDAQNQFTGVWITYEVNRRLLDFNLGTMALDESGLWVDPGPIRGGVPPYAVTSCNDVDNPLLAPDDQQRFEAAEELPQAEPGGELEEGETQTLELFRIPPPPPAPSL